MSKRLEKFHSVTHCSLQLNDTEMWQKEDVQHTQFLVHSFLLGLQSIHLCTFRICLLRDPRDNQCNVLFQLNKCTDFQTHMDKVCSHLSGRL